MRSLLEHHPEKILIRATNWIGDAIMTTPAVRTIRQNFPDAHISILALDWVADVFAASPHVDEVILYYKKSDHKGFPGLLRLGRRLAARNFDLAILLQNAFEAAFLAWLAGIPLRAGYQRDGRSLLLTHRVKIRPEVRKKHQVYYYQGLLADLGLSPGKNELFLQISPEAEKWAAEFRSKFGGKPLIGLNPGAAFGPAKCWPAERYGELGARLNHESGAEIVVFGTGNDRETTAAIKKFAPEHIHDLAGKTSLSQAMALIAACDAFVTNDSGLMHVGAALNTPLVAIFGSTDSVATGPFSRQAEVIEKNIACKPCLKKECASGFSCMLDISVDDVFKKLLTVYQKNM